MIRAAMWTCRVLGVLFVMIGLVAFVAGEAADTYHNLLHFGTGLVALYFGFVASRAAARRFCLAFGAGYLALGATGFLVGDAAFDLMWHVGPVHLALGDHVFHIVLGAIMVVGGALTRSRAGSLGESFAS